MLVQEIISDMGYRVVRNAPYSGGFITRNYGRPTDGIHALQIEIKRGLYMDEDNYTRNSGMSEIIQDMTYLTEQLVSLEPQALAA
jgi:N-formylglutamate amidohydrolase